MKTLISTKFFATIILSIVAMAVYAQETPCDTFFSCHSAKTLRMLANNKSISLIVEKFDDGAENYYYTTGLEESAAEDDITYLTKYQNVKELCVMEKDGKTLLVTFESESKNPNTLTFDIPDPSNRYVTAYTGTKNVMQGLNMNFSKGSRHNWDFVSYGLGIGWVTPLNAPGGMDVSMGRSLELTWTMIAGVKWSYGRHSISAGLGIDGRSLTMKNGRYFHKEDDGRIALRPFAEEQEKGISTLSTFMLQVPILYDLRFGRSRHFGFSLGPVVNFNVTGSLTTRYTVGDSDYLISTRHIGQRPVTVDLLGVLHYSPLSLYVRYAPMTLLKDRADLPFSAFSTGVMLFF